MMDINEVYAVYRKHLYIESTHLIDIPMAVYATKDLPGDPEYVFPLGPSGIGKSVMVEPYAEMSKNPANNIMLVDSITAKHFTAKETKERLEKNNTLILIPDLAGILSTSPDERAELFATLRTLFDGSVSRKTHGKDTSTEYRCHVSILAMGVPNSKEDIELQNMMGTREILYDLQRPRNWENMYDYNLDDKGRKEINMVIQEFFNKFPYIFKEPTKENIKFLQEIAEYISIWRAEPLTDQTTGFVKSTLSQEVPVRVFKQLKKLWIGMDAIGIPVEQIKENIRTISRGCGNEIRRRVYECLAPEKKHTEIWSELDQDGIPIVEDVIDEVIQPEKTRQKISEELNCDPKTILTQLMVLRAFGYVKPAPPIELKSFPAEAMSIPWDIYDQKTAWKRIR